MASTKINNLFTGRVHAKPEHMDSMFGQYKGVVVNAAAVSESVEGFIAKIVIGLKEYMLVLIEVDDAKAVNKNEISSYRNPEMRKVLRKALTNKSAQFEVFYTYDSE